jgi:hypothetical protein
MRSSNPDNDLFVAILLCNCIRDSRMWIAYKKLSWAAVWRRKGLRTNALGFSQPSTSATCTRTSVVLFFKLLVCE